MQLAKELLALKVAARVGFEDCVSQNPPPSGLPRLDLFPAIGDLNGFASVIAVVPSNSLNVAICGLTQKSREPEARRFRAVRDQLAQCHGMASVTG